MNYNLHRAIKFTTNKPCITCCKLVCTLLQQMWHNNKTDLEPIHLLVSRLLCSYIVTMCKHYMHCTCISVLFVILCDAVCNIHKHIFKTLHWYEGIALLFRCLPAVLRSNKDCLNLNSNWNLETQRCVIAFHMSFLYINATCCQATSYSQTTLITWKQYHGYVNILSLGPLW